MKKLITLLVLFTFINVNSQSLNVPSLIDRPFIEITGTSETEVTPDEFM